MLMASTGRVFRQEIWRRFACFRVVRFGVFAVHDDFCAEFDSRQLHQKWLARAISPGEVSFPINHTWPSQAAFTWGEVSIYYIDHLPQVEEFGEHTWDYR